IRGIGKHKDRKLRKNKRASMIFTRLKRNIPPNPSEKMRIARKDAGVRDVPKSGKWQILVSGFYR
ncbi:MAG: hypothetical protein LBT05_16070, partial [Planctomycetaceae bacterium]|nr:hypothetical protein [Planctomycetaceae bacterium]